jgi:hypothetical protein
MRVIKVVHSDQEEVLEHEKQQFRIQNYDANAFIENSKLIRFKHLCYLRTVNPLSLMMKIEPRFVNRKSIEKSMNEMHEQYESAVDDITRETIDALLKDIVEQLNKSEVINLDTAKARYPKTNNLSVGTYTLHPYDNQKLTRLEHFHKNLALEKDDELIVLLGKMGAKSVRIIETDTQRKAGIGNLKSEVFSSDAKVGISLSGSTERSTDLLVTFEGNIVDIDPHLLETSLWFCTDSKLNAIFESRRFNPNKIEQYTLINTYTETFDFDFDLATRYLVVEADLKAEYHSISNKERFFHVEFGK